ncbi:protein translocase subunit SecD [Chloroflexota bacterium]
MFLFILALLGTSIWILTPSGSTQLDREKEDLGMRLGLDLAGGIHLVYEADLTGQEDPGGVMSGTVDVIESRINVLGVSEPVILRQGDDRIVIQLAGLEDIEEAKNLIGLTALLEFRKLDADGETWIPATGMIDDEEKALTSTYFKTNTYITLEQFTNKPVLVFEWNDEGSELSKQITGAMIGEPLGIFLGDEPLLGDDDQPIAPIVQSVIEDEGQITGLSFDEASKLKNLLNAGRIPVPLTPIYQNQVSPTLGDDFVDQSVLAGLVGMGLIVLFMILYYRLPGIVASLSLLVYVAIVLAIFKLIPVTLTLAGLAGFILSIGMAVDANVLIFERMKEELRGGRTIKAAANTGFSRAWTAIRDSNISTLIICGILYWFGSSIVDSPTVTGFAVTLAIGVAVSMFSAIVVTRSFLRFTTGARAYRNIKWFGVEASDV